jgi:ABC-type proline/glycine betaine transport system substrate-binding protein
MKHVMTLVAATAGIALATLAAPAAAEPDANLPVRISEKLVADLARADLDANLGRRVEISRTKLR